MLLGLDIGERRIVGVVVDGQGAVVRRAVAAVPGATPRDVAGELAAGQTIDALGLALERAGDEAGTLRSIKTTHPPVVCTPGAAAVMAEAWVGAARDSRHAICLTVGDRVLAGILLDGRHWPGAHGFAGSAAWLSLNPVERQDYRKYGGLAAEVSHDGIARRLSWRIQAGDESDVLTRAGDLASITAAHVFDAARAGDGVSISVVRDTAKYIGMALANLALCIDPEVIVLGGNAAMMADLLLEPVRQDFIRRIPPGMIDEVRLVISPLGDDGIAIGAARIAALAHP
jgi:predicted NBD/HSP70 family sugar kinase